ncbi:hypothetical protein B2G71_06840 [Novosphingobium sp. PC22D]|uniref:hypothetical protein n=1 Tax=Novosphingobium sp. PC22D TaxID=1962403 RepID=UPI000BF05C4A|nr:hypothetical protein [Novosphingobium sp. PC22D]PEQ13163.1 hypothetical protein B2G71_06840 [Novosphingobium sp. PC22D]
MTKSRHESEQRSLIHTELRRLRCEVADLRARLSEGESPEGRGGVSAADQSRWQLAEMPDVDGLLRIARTLQRKRKESFDPRWIEGPAWSILLLLFERRDNRESETGIRIETGLARALVHRWLGLLRNFGFVELCPRDGREYANVRLTDYGRLQMTDVFFETGLALKGHAADA